MKRPVYFVLGVLVIGAIAYLVYQYRVPLGLAGSGGSQESVSTGQANPDLRPAHIVWQTVDRTSEGFKVEMPAGTNQIQVPAFNESGGQEPVNMIQASLDPETTYAITWADNPPVERAAGQSAEKTLDMARDGALSRTQTTLISESRNNRGGYPACDFSGRNEGGGILNARLILAGTRLYMLIAAFPAASARRDEDVSRFFGSFTLTLASRNE